MANWYRVYRAARSTALAASAAAVLGLAVSADAEAQKPVALALDVAGQTEPAIARSQEIAPAATIALGAGATLRLYHYGACKVVTVAGGTLEITRFGYRVGGGGRITREVKRRCPKRVRLASTAGGRATAGVTLRNFGAPDVHVIGTTPAFILIAAAADRVARAELVAATGGSPVALARTGRTLGWPPGSPPLGSDGFHQLRLLGADGAPIAQVRMRVGDKAPDEPEFLRVE